MNEYYKKKYLKYKNKYVQLYEIINNLKQDNVLNGGSIYKSKSTKKSTKKLTNKSIKSKFECYPENKFINICQENTNGKYNSKEGCVNDCEIKYINNKLTEIKIKQETIPFYLFIKDIINNEKLYVYLKGGNVLGLKVLKMIYIKYKSNDIKFIEVFNKFLELELIKDWDFSAYTQNDKEITSYYREHLDKVASKYKLHQRASTFILYQTKKPLLLEEKPLFEISLLDSDSWSKLEIPLTTMKVKINEYNIKYVFMFCKLFYSYKNYEEEFDYDILYRMLEKINIIIYPHKNGLYNVSNNFDKGELNDELIEFIKKYDDFDKNIPQFLATHIEDPFRILYRLPEKNIPKNDKIKNFLKEHLDIKNEEWLFDSTFIKKMTKLFCENLGKKLVEIYKESYIKTLDIKKSIERVDSFLKGVSLARRIEMDYGMLTDNGKNLLKLIFNDLINEIDKKNINEIDMKINLFKFIKFYANKTK